jgi:hypothetical protein
MWWPLRRSVQKLGWPVEMYGTGVSVPWTKDLSWQCREGKVPTLYIALRFWLTSWCWFNAVTSTLREIYFRRAAFHPSASFPVTANMFSWIELMLNVYSISPGEGVGVSKPFQIKVQGGDDMYKWIDPASRLPKLFTISSAFAQLSRCGQSTSIVIFPHLRWSLAR